MPSSNGSIRSSKILEEMTPIQKKPIDPTNVDTESRRYWNRIFKVMNAYKKIPLHKREHILEEVLDNAYLVKKLQAIYDVREYDDIVDYDELMQKPEEVLSDEEQFRRKHYNAHLNSLILNLVKPRRIITDDSHITAPSKRKRISPTDYRKELTINEEDRSKSENTMYENFLTKSPERANRWRPKPPVTFKGMSLAAMCDTITKDIATDFVEWINNLGGETKSTLDVKGLLSLFEIGFNCHAVDSLMVDVKELNAVNDPIARACQTPEKSYSTQLYRQLYRDMTAVKSREANFAFGTMLPPEMRAGTTQASSVFKWMQNLRVPEKLATMAVVWEGIESLRITEEYCVWLVEHPVQKPPGYLESKGMLKHLLRKTDKSAVLKSFYAMQTLPTSSYNLVN